MINVLALNSGSSSLKFGLFSVTATKTNMLLSGTFEMISEVNRKLLIEDAQQQTLISETAAIPSPRDAIIHITQVLAELEISSPEVIGHRIVHGGPHLRKHCLIDELVMRELEASIAFASLHTPSTLTVIRAAQEHFPLIP